MKDVMSIHAHYDYSLLSHRPRYHYEIPVVTLKEFYEEMFLGWSYGARLYHSLTWLTINEQTHTPVAYQAAVAGVVYEGIYVPSDTPIYRQSSITGEKVEMEKRSYHCHLSVHTLRKDAPFEDNPWKVHSVIGGLPALGYTPKINPHDYPDNIPDPENVILQTEAEMKQGVANIDDHDIALFVDVNAGNPIANHFYGWEVAGIQRGLDRDYD